MRVHGESEAMPNSDRRWLRRYAPAVALALALLIARLVLARAAFAHPQDALLTDSSGYLELAGNLRLMGRFQASPHEEGLRTPVYPLFLAGVQTAFGEEIGFIILSQLGISLGTAWLIWRTGREIGGPRVGMAAVWLYAVNPNSLFWAGTVMSETLFAFWLALSACLSAISLRHRSWIPAGAGGLSLGLAVLTRPIGAYLVPIWVVGVLGAHWRSLGRRSALIRTAAFLLLALTPIVAWQTRNAVVHGRFFLANVGPATFSNYIVGYVLEDALGIPREEAVGLLASADNRLLYSLEVIREYPASFLRVTARGVFRTLLGTEVGVWLPVASGLTYQGSGLLGAVFAGNWSAIVEAVRVRLQAAGDVAGTVLLLWGAIYSLVLYLCIIRGLIAARRLRQPGLGWLMALMIVSAAYLILVPLSNGDARFRMPTEPWLAVLGGLAWLGRRAMPAAVAAESAEA